ncbi:flagellar biosynthesis repressor FlbT [Azospirillum sp. A1-3]|uniref:flagellar biosynthesis repressor FlbT n=1 Tax=Azospirillum sp. A1-3 TaxID=185874 RepID=UPI0020777FFD|nr:flagellar biosynthesis repressor FlbT [Azospirillum sp. A1-3]MCM8738738.1 flagellar biosynthesis repressor FlbT [Azospirillum sp. A1-3]
MPLKVVLRPNERVLINGAVVGAADRWTTIILHSQTRFLRERELLAESLVDNAEKGLYFAIQCQLAAPDGGAIDHARIADAVAAVRACRPDLMAQIEEVEQLVQAGQLYPALKRCRRLLQAGAPFPSTDGTPQAEAED